MKNHEKIYTVPTLEVEELVVEKGVALSGNYGDSGAPGQNSGYIDNDYDL